MARVVLAGLLVVLTAAGTAAARSIPGEQQGHVPDGVQRASYDKWLAAKDNAEKHDRAGNYVAALQHYLEYTCLAERIGRPGLVAWGKNNAAYMIIKMHLEDPSFDLVPARKLLEEGLAIAGSTEACRKALALNLEYVNSRLRD